MPASKKTADRIEKVIEGLEMGLPFNISCDYAMLHVDTVYKWIRNDEYVSRRVSFAKSKAQAGVVAELTKKDPKYWLQKRDPENWAEEKPEQSFKVIVNMPDGNKKEL